MKGAPFLVFLIAALSCAGQDVGQELDTLPIVPAYYDDKVEAFQQEVVSEGHIMFLGNSITERGDFKSLLNDTTIVNRGISGDVTFGIIRRLDEITRFKPSKLFLLIGINDLSKGTPENVILNNIFTIISTVHAQSPKTEIFVQSILPVNPGVKDFPKGYDVNEGVNLIDSQLPNVENRLNFTFVDLHKHFVDADGLMNVKYTTDGLHLSPEGYALWIKILKDAKHL